MTTTPILKNNTTIASLPVYDTFMLEWELMAAKVIVADFEWPEYVDVPVGAYIDRKGERFTINTVPNVTKEADNSFKYSVRFESDLYRLYDKKLRHLNSRTFQFYGTLLEFANLIISNINEIAPGHTVGEVDNLPAKTINFSSHTCIMAVDTVAEAFGVEWDFRNKTLSFKKKIGRDTTHVFEVGRGKGLYTLTREYQNDKNIVTRAYGYGSSRNLPEGYTGTELSLPEGYMEKNVDLYGVKEGDYVNEDIYAKVDSAITGFTPWTEGAGTFKVQDSTLNFNINDNLSPLNAKLSFTSGELQGQEFEIVKFDNATKTYTLKTFVDTSTGRTLPDAVLGAANGDTYTLFDIYMPAERNTAAITELRAATQAWLDENSVPQVKYSLEIDPLHARNNSIMLEPGDRIQLVDAQLGIDLIIRVTKVSYPINFPEELTPNTKINIEIANFIPYTTTERIINSVIENKSALTNAKTKSDITQMAVEALRSKTGIDWLPPGTILIDPATGLIASSLIIADMVVARQVRTAITGARTEMYGSTTDTYNANNVLASRRTTNEAGLMTEVWYNPNGDPIYEIGQLGPRWFENVEPSWTATKFRSLLTNPNANFAALADAVNNSVTCFINQNGNQYVGIEANKTAYLYNAGQNPSAEFNRPYEAFKNTSGSIQGDNIPDGWYMFADTVLQTGVSSGPGATTPKIVDARFGYATQGGTMPTGGQGGTIMPVTTIEQLRNACQNQNDARLIVVEVTVQGFVGEIIWVGSNKTVVCKPGVEILGACLKAGAGADPHNNIIFRNIKSRDVRTNTNLLVRDGAHHVWIDHCEGSADRDHGWDGYYDGLLDIGRGASYVTCTFNRLHDSHIPMQMGFDNSHTEDIGKIKVTLAYNWYHDVSERQPSGRYGEIHCFNNYHHNAGYSIASAMNAQFRLDNNHFDNVTIPVRTDINDVPGLVSGIETNKFTNCGENHILDEHKNLWLPPYLYADDYLMPKDNVEAFVKANAGATLTEDKLFDFTMPAPSGATVTSGGLGEGEPGYILEFKYMTNGKVTNGMTGVKSLEPTHACTFEY